MIRNCIFGLSIFVATISNAQNYRSERLSEHGVEIVRLTDLAHEVTVSILPSAGNRAYEMRVHGKNILYFPYTDVSELQKQPRLCGIPFLAPWADLLNEPAFWANGKRYAFNMELGNVRGKMPIHGLLANSPLWRVTEVTADAVSARVTSRLEFWRYPDLVAQWPFAHEYEITYSLAAGELEVKTTVHQPERGSDAPGNWISFFFSNPGHPARRMGRALSGPCARDRG